jgi:DNA-binding winged helix-turn-helix (wHTH) protein
MEITAKRLQFSSFTLDLDRLCLFGPSGRASLRPKSFDVLRYLVAHPRRVVGKDELIKAVWPNVIVTDESLTRCISDVRHALGDASQQIIKTVPKRGYLLDQEVSVLDTTTGATPDRIKACTPDDFFLPTEGPIVGVFPFRAISGDPRYANCMNGIAESIIVALSRCTWLTTVPADIAQSSGSEHHTKGPVRPNYTLRGTAVHIGNRLRVTVHLIDALSGVQIWADRLSGDTDEIFELHDRIAERVVAAIEPVLENAEFKRLTCKSVADLSPYELVLRAAVLESEFTKDSCAPRVATQSLQQPSLR